MAGFRWTVTQLLLQVYYDSLHDPQDDDFVHSGNGGIAAEVWKKYFSATIRFCYLF
jgi:hypothetical protein